MPRYCLLLIGVLAIISIADPAHANDLLRLYKLAVSRDTVLQAAMDQRDAAIEARPQAFAQWLPQVSGTASKERESEDKEPALFGLETGGNSPPPLGSFGVPGCQLADTATVRCNMDYTTYGLTLSQTLWSYQAYSQLKEADAQAAAAEATYLGAQQDLIVSVAQTYFAVLEAQDQLRTVRHEREAFRLLLQQTKDRERTGVGSASDAIQAQAFYDRTAQGLINARNALSEAKLALEVIVGEPPGHMAVLREQIPLTAPDPASADAWVTSALRDNPDVRAADLTTEAAKRDISVQRGKALPTFSLEARGARAIAPLVLGGNTRIATVGIYFNWPLFQGGAVASAIRQSRAIYRQNEADLTSLRRETAQQTRDAYLNIVTGIRGIDAARRAVESANAAVLAVRRDIQFNVAPEFVLLQYQQGYYTAVDAYDEARYQYLDNVLILKQQAGELSKRDLEEIDALLVTGGAEN